MKIEKSKAAFTIVELLVVIVVIGILAAATIVSYSGISKKAIIAGLQSDLDNNARLLKMYNVEYGSYPSTLDDNKCPLTPNINTRYCLKASIDTTLVYTGGGQSFTLTAIKNSISYEITEGLSPYNSTKIPITAIATITGSPQINQTLTAGAVTPADATVSYQWQSAATSGGTYTDISGATSKTIILNPSNVNKFLKVVVTGTGDYINTLASAATTSAVVVDANWATIGVQTWAKSNLDVGTMITGVTSQTNNSVVEKYCYGNTSANCVTYGALYQWDEAMQYSATEGAQGICPTGSHIPSDSEWKTLEMQLGLTQAQADTSGSYRGTNQGTQLKSGGSTGLNIPIAGSRDPAGAFSSINLGAGLWSSSASGANAWDRGVGSTNTNIYRDTVSKAYGFSIRCVAN